MRVDEFDFDLPEENIALRPVEPRDASRLLVVNKTGQGSLADHSFPDLLDFLNPGDALVFNDTRVIPAQLEGRRVRGAAIANFGATLHMRTAPNVWQAFIRGAKKLKSGETVSFGGRDELKAIVGEKDDGGGVELIFNQSGPDLDTMLVQVGHIPLPPYIAGKRRDDERDKRDYQTIYARKDGAVAAPTAGLHFTDRIMEALDAKGIERHFVTLHVGAGTFLRVKAETTEEHKMHAETGTVSRQTADALNTARARGNRIISVGTTSLRLLESSINGKGQIGEWSGSTDIFITPGTTIRSVDALLTNFHLPKSTLFMLVSAFSGTAVMRAAYEHAISGRYRFYSYGDSSLLFPSSGNVG